MGWWSFSSHFWKETFRDCENDLSTKTKYLGASQHPKERDKREEKEKSYLFVSQDSEWWAGQTEPQSGSSMAITETVFGGRKGHYPIKRINIYPIYLA